jgi:hypothetical protein
MSVHFVAVATIPTRFCVRNVCAPEQMYGPPQWPGFAPPLTHFRPTRVRWRESHVQYNLNPIRYQRTTVSG